MAEKQGLGGLFGAASGDGHYCPEGIPVELGLLSRRVLAIFLALNRGGEVVRLVEVVRLRSLVNEARPENKL